MTLASLHVWFLQFDKPWWLAVAVPAWAITLWLGRSTLTGLGTSARRAALAVRLVVILLLAMAMAHPQLRREAENVTVTIIQDMSESVKRPAPGPDGEAQDLLGVSSAFVDRALEPGRGGPRPGDLVARLTAAQKAYVQALPVRPGEKPDLTFTGPTDATNLADAVNMALAVMPAETANRLLIISDGNQTAGDLLAAAGAAKAAGVPIDVLPLRYRFTNEVVVERLVAPGSARMGQNVNLRAVINAQQPASGTLRLLINGEAADLDPSSPGDGIKVSLSQGINAIPIPISLPKAGPQQFEAVFEPDDGNAGTTRENKRALAVTFVQSEGRVLVVSPAAEEVEPLVAVLGEARIAADVVSPTAAPTSLVEWGAYDGVVIANTSASALTQDQQTQLKQYIHDLGGGMLMVGGPDSFGAGGWLGSPLAEALPIKLDPPQKRQMPRGALALVMHSCEMPQGNYWGVQTALAAVNNLSRQDLVGVLEWDWTRGDVWVHPMSPVGNRAAVARAVNSLTFGDTQSFDGMFQMAYDALVKADAGMKHVIVISDGDPQLANTGILAQFRAARISVTGVLVYPHNRAAGGPDWEQMRRIARETGGRFYPVIDQGQFATLPSIFIKEAQVVKRTLIWEGTPFVPTVANAVSEPMRGLTEVPAIGGYVVAADREGLSVVTLRGKENDPILAHWQHGLGKVVTFTSDVSARWARAWPSWGRFRAFWEQHVRWAMRPSGSADMRVLTEDQGDRTRLIVEAVDTGGERMNFVRFTGRVVRPDGTAEDVSLRQVGPGRYEGSFASGSTGAYVASLRYTAPSGDGPAKEGTVQAAVTRPFADEYRALSDNAPLLRAVAERTGGREVDPDPAKAELFRREGLTMPVATSAVWMQVALLAIGMFLTDVAVRRVRIDPRAIAAWARRGMGRRVEQAGQQLGSLKEARDRAKAGMDEQRKRELTRAAQQAEKAVATRKFEASDTELKKARTNDALADPTQGGPGQPKPPIVEKKAPPPDAGGEQGLSRLKKAKKRAQDEMDE
jgi:uncharacterized membrane protein